MLILKNNQIVSVSTIEDKTSEVYATMTVEKLQIKYINSSVTKGVKYMMIQHFEQGIHYNKYNFKVI